jgi:hypothetical protein
MSKLQSLQAWRSFEIHPQQRRSAQKNCCTCHDSRLMNRFDEEISWRDMNSDISDFMQNSCGRHWKSLQKFRGTPSVRCELAIQRWASVRRTTFDTKNKKKSTTEALKQVEECLAVDPLILSSSSTKPAVEIQMFTQFSMFSHAISIILDLSHVRNCSVLVRRLFLVRHEPPQCPTGNLNRNVAKHCIAGMSWDMSWHMSWHML